MPQELHKKRKAEVAAEAAAEHSKRAHKHAPAVASSKKPVRTKDRVSAVDSLSRIGGDGGSGAAEKSVDPRFSDLNGKFSSDHFLKSYSFLDEQQAAEVQNMAKRLKKRKGSAAVKGSHSTEALHQVRGRANMDADDCLVPLSHSTNLTFSPTYFSLCTIPHYIPYTSHSLTPTLTGIYQEQARDD
jgi:hypothetical protein